MTVLVAAHPDDEVIGAGAQFSRMRHYHFVHITDGAPKNMRDAITLGFKTREAYARARRLEFTAALAKAGVDTNRTSELEIPEREASFNLQDISRRLFDLFLEVRPRIVFTHPYEGGHPDHDAAAFACHAACRLMQKHKMYPPVIFEFTSYHAHGGQLVTGDFLPAPRNNDIMTFRLQPAQRELKRQMIDCFQTQRKVLADYRFDVERFRLAPQYDFTSPPHAGKLYYENFEWGITGHEWREGAAESLVSLGLEAETMLNACHP